MKKHQKYQNYENIKNIKNIKDIENIARGVGRLWKGKTPDSLPEPEHQNKPKTRTMAGLTALCYW